MSKIALNAPASGTGVITLTAPVTNTDRVLSLPDNSGTVLNENSNIEAQVKTATNATGTAPIFAARAWVNFNGTGTVAIRASGNVSSLVDNGVGDYTINFATAMPDANYSVDGTSSRLNSGDPGILSPIALSAGSVQVQTGLRTVGSFDNSINSVAIFR